VREVRRTAIARAAGLSPAEALGTTCALLEEACPAEPAAIVEGEYGHGFADALHYGAAQAAALREEVAALHAELDAAIARIQGEEE
jgi:hypothetical protein